MRRAQLRIERYNREAMPLSWGGQDGGVDTRGRVSFLSQASAIPGSRALGGFALLDSRTEEDELDDYERIEVLLAEAQATTRLPEHAELDDSRQGLDSDDRL
mmetsp:Transcript_35848/g.66908  ORF Transcript_35848/g.66908 Transcript_35848/m.66908 type:complete len:102 (-) Transcript_35848:116-421(-)